MVGAWVRCNKYVWMIFIIPCVLEPIIVTTALNESQKHLSMTPVSLITPMPVTQQGCNIMQVLYRYHCLIVNDKTHIAADNGTSLSINMNCKHMLCETNYATYYTMVCTRKEMLFILLFLPLCVAASKDLWIVGGGDALISDFPWQVRPLIHYNTCSCEYLSLKTRSEYTWPFQGSNPSLSILTR